MPQSVLSDFLGRIRNISLAPSAANSLVPLFEAITNSVQAIEDRFGSDSLTKGEVLIEVLRDGVDDTINGFEISDNGIGLNVDNMGSFAKADSRYKLSRGGKGVGRFMWLKVFEQAHIESRFGPKDEETLSFDFVLEEENQIRNEGSALRLKDSGTVVRLAPFRAEYRIVAPKKTETLVAKIISHFLALFVSLNPPKIVLVDADTRLDIFAAFSDLVRDDEAKPFSIRHNEADLKFQFNCYLLPKHLSDDEKGVNAIFYGANGRSVVRTPVDRALGLDVIAGKFAFFACVSGDYLNEHVNQERTGFSWPDELRKEVNSRALDFSKQFLSKYIEEIRQKQAVSVAKLLREHLRFMTVIHDPAVFAKTLDLSVQTEEEIYLEISRASLRKERKVRREYAEAVKTREHVEEGVRKYADELRAESAASLASYVFKRKLILDVLHDHMRYDGLDTDRYHLEETVHALICPLKMTKEDLHYNDHNLWIIDDQLAFYSYFNSDKTLKSITGEADKSTKEPDITFFDLGIGLERAGTQDPVSIIEFKRPMRDDYTLADNPIVQIRDYCMRLRNAKKITSHDGAELRAIDEKTPFTGHIIADITPSLLRMMQQFGTYTQKAGHSCYYKWDADYSMFIQIQSYNDLIQGARARHQAFFQQLGLVN